MMQESDKRYLCQGTLQQLLCLLGSKCFCEQLIKRITYADALPAIEHLQRAADEMEAAYHIFTDDIAPEQAQRLVRYNESHRLELVPAFDPSLSKVPVIMDWAHVRVMVDVLNAEVCTLCDKDKDGVRRCELRQAVYDIGGKPDEGKAKINPWCEISRGIL